MKKFYFITLALVGVLNSIILVELNQKIDDTQIAIGRLGELIIDKKIKESN